MTSSATSYGSISWAKNGNYSELLLHHIQLMDAARFAGMNWQKCRTSSHTLPADYFKVLYLHLPAGTEENHENPQDSLYPAEIQIGHLDVLPPEPPCSFWRRDWNYASDRPAKFSRLLQNRGGHHATSRKVAGSIPDEIVGFFQLI
jgi:hypothetical protein